VLIIAKLVTMINRANAHVLVQIVHEHQASPLQLQNICKTLITKSLAHDTMHNIYYLAQKPTESQLNLLHYTWKLTN